MYTLTMKVRLKKLGEGGGRTLEIFFQQEGKKDRTYTCVAVREKKGAERSRNNHGEKKGLSSSVSSREGENEADRGKKKRVRGGRRKRPYTSSEKSDGEKEFTRD